MHNANKGIRIAEVGFLRGGKRIGLTRMELLVVLAIIGLIATFFLSTEQTEDYRIHSPGFKQWRTLLTSTSIEFLL